MKLPKACVVTGANSGIGRSTAILLAKSGYRVFATMRSLDRGQKLRDAAQSANLEISEVELDSAAKQLELYTESKEDAITYAKKELKTQVEDSYWHKYWSGLIKRLES